MRTRWLNIIWQSFVWLLLVGILAISLGFTEKHRKEILCTSIFVRVLDSIENHFIKSKDILNLLKEKKIKIINEPIALLPLNEIETTLNKVPYIYSAQTYATLDGILYIDLIQRSPMMRIINYNYESYYIDTEGQLFPLSENYTARVLVATGNLNEPYALFCNKKAYEAEQQELIKRKTLLDDIYYLASYIYSDSLWSAMIEQIFVNENREFELIPKIGDVIIEFGDTANLKEKFIKLKAFYEQVIPKINLDEYSKINLKYKNQIVCTKKI